MHMKQNRFPEPFRSVGPQEPQTPAPPRVVNPGARRRQAVLITGIGSLTLLFVVTPIFARPVPAVTKRISAGEPLQNDPSRAAATPVLIEIAPTGAPDTAGFVQISRFTELQLGDDYPAVQQLQTKLTALGYLDADEPSTVYNSALADAVSMFQRAHGMAVDGEADVELQDALFNSHALTYRVALGDEGDDVACLQNGLAALGYFSGKATGYFGTATEAALSAFQKNNGMEPDGIFDADDRERMYSPQAVKADGPASTTAPTAAPSPTPAPSKRPAATAGPVTQNQPDEPEPLPIVLPDSLETEPPIEPLITLPPAMGLEQFPTVDPGAPATIPDPTAAPAEQPGEEPTAAPEPTVETPDAPEQEDQPDVIEGVITTALAQLGKPYKRGAEGPSSYDCSGLVYYCLTQNGVRVGRYSASSYSKITDWKKISSMGKLRRGDLIFYHDDDSSRVSHVGICLGDGTMVDASSNKSQIVHRSHTTAYWQRNFVCGRRIF